MALSKPLERRQFLRSAGALFASSLLPASAEAMTKSEIVYASAFFDGDHTFGVALLDQDGRKLTTFPLPARGHDVVSSRLANKLVAFARRPGTFAVALDLSRKKAPQFFNAPLDLHFYGHGAFSADGRLLYATENDFENSAGKIGIYDAMSSFARIGEFETFGMGPHDIVLLPDEKTLVVANGGIETHPDYGRTKLNLASMESSVCFIDIDTGRLVRRFCLPKSLHQVSLRHMAVEGGADIWLAGQYEGSEPNGAGLVYRLSRANGLQAIPLPATVTGSLNGYVGSIAYDRSRNEIGITSPMGGVVAKFSPHAPQDAVLQTMPKACGLAVGENGFLASSRVGGMRHGDQVVETENWAWDNHIARV